jgi:uncharacterized DUF497 family protein
VAPRIESMKFEWDAAKARSNLRKHGVSFEEASTVFYDTLAATGADPDHSAHEDRFVTFGLSSQGRLLVVAHADRNDSIRIITARPATSPERRIYEES